MGEGEGVRYGGWRGVGRGGVRRVPSAALCMRTGGVVVPHSQPREGGWSVEGEGEEVSLARGEGSEPHVARVTRGVHSVEELGGRARVVLQPRQRVHARRLGVQLPYRIGRAERGARGVPELDGGEADVVRVAPG